MGILWEFVWKIVSEHGKRVPSIKYLMHAAAFELKKWVLNRKIELLFLLRPLLFQCSRVNYLYWMKCKWDCSRCANRSSFWYYNKKVVEAENEKRNYGHTYRWTIRHFANMRTCFLLVCRNWCIFICWAKIGT